MVDTGFSFHQLAASSSSSVDSLQAPDDEDQFDRRRHPVKYYLVDFSKAVVLPTPGPLSPSEGGAEKVLSGDDLLLHDVIDCGTLIVIFMSRVRSSPLLVIPS